MTPLEQAAAYGHADAVEVLLRAGARQHVDALAAARESRDHVPERARQNTIRVLEAHARALAQQARLAAPVDEAARELEARRREQTRAEAAAELAAGRARVEEEAAAAREAERQREAQRRERVAAERAARASAGQEGGSSAPGPSHREGQRQERPALSREEQLARQRWVEERPLRAMAFDNRQRDAQREALARRARERRERERRAAAEADMNMQARRHVVPTAPTVADHVLAAALAASSLD